jgi:hypothetical protein
VPIDQTDEARYHGEPRTMLKSRGAPLILSGRRHLFPGTMDCHERTA